MSVSGRSSRLAAAAFGAFALAATSAVGGATIKVADIPDADGSPIHVGDEGFVPTTSSETVAT